MSHATAEVVSDVGGRPRDPRIERAVLEATRALLVSGGYADLTLAEVARRARTTKPAIYRRWRSKAHLVHEAAFPVEDAQRAEESGDGTLAGELRAAVAVTARMLSSPPARAAMPGLVAEFQADPLLHASLLERFRQGPISEVGRRLAGAPGARPDLDVNALVGLIAGSVLFALLVDVDTDFGPDWIETTTSLLLRGAGHD